MQVSPSQAGPQSRSDAHELFGLLPPATQLPASPQTHWQSQSASDVQG
jgi:hypothetical protein